MTDREAMQMALEALDCIYSPLHVREINKVGSAMQVLRAQLEQPEQEPVAYWIPKAEQFCIADPSGRPFAKAWEPLYTSPPAAQRKPLTEKQVSRLWSKAHDDTTDLMAFQVFARAIEAAHGIGEKNDQ